MAKSSSSSSDFSNEEEYLSIDSETSFDKQKYLSTYGTDSSDEEDKVHSYDILEKVQTYKTTNNEKNNILSFIIHAVAIKFLYSKQIQTRYYKLKKEFCENSFEYDDNMIKASVKQSIILEDEVNEDPIMSYITKNIDNFYRTRFNKSKLIKFLKKLQEDLELTPNNDDFLLSEHQDNPEAYLVNVDENFILDKGYIKKSKSKINITVSDSVGFFAQLRLHNNTNWRLEKYGYKCEKNYIIKYNDTVSVTVIDRVVENLKGYFYREEEVQINGETSNSYVEIFKKLSTNDFAQLEKPFCEIKIQELSQNAANLHYLLYGTEVIKNPSALIHNMMAIDLIISKQMSWENALCDEMIPMCIDRAVAASRRINIHYNEYMPHSYKYDSGTGKYPGKENINNLIEKGVKSIKKKELKLMDMWLKLKSMKVNISNEDEELTFYKEVFETIETACKEWYLGDEKEVIISGVNDDNNDNNLS